MTPLNINFNDHFQAVDLKVKKVKFNSEFDAIVNTMSGQYNFTFEPGTSYLLQLDEGTTPDFVHAYLGSIDAVFDIPKYLIDRISD